MSSSSGSYFHQSCHVTKAASTDIKAAELAQFFAE